MKFKGLKVGDRVYVSYRQGGAEREVTKVGRKFFKAGGSEFSLEDGSLRGDYSYPCAATMAEHQLPMRAKEAREKLLAWGIELRYATADDKVVIVWEALQAYDARARELASGESR